jgi:hypothetical protein
VALEVAQLPGGREEVCSKFDESLGGVQDCSGRAASGLLVVDYPWRCSACDRGDVDVGQCRRRLNVVGEPKPLLRLHLHSASRFAGPFNVLFRVSLLVTFSLVTLLSQVVKHPGISLFFLPSSCDYIYILVNFNSTYYMKEEVTDAEIVIH